MIDKAVQMAARRNTLVPIPDHAVLKIGRKPTFDALQFIHVPCRQPAVFLITRQAEPPLDEARIDAVIGVSHEGEAKVVFPVPRSPASQTTP